MEMILSFFPLMVSSTRGIESLNDFSKTRCLIEKVVLLWESLESTNLPGNKSTLTEIPSKKDGWTVW